MESDTDEKMKKGLACLAYSQKYITFIYESTLEKRKKGGTKKFFFNDIHLRFIRFIISTLNLAYPFIIVTIR